MSATVSILSRKFARNFFQIARPCQKTIKSDTVAKGSKLVRQGATAWAALIPPKGKKVVNRPCVIITPDELIATSEVIQVIGISHSFRPDDPDMVLLPWHADGKCSSGLIMPSAAMICWVCSVKKVDLKIQGNIPKAHLIEILDRLTEYLSR